MKYWNSFFYNSIEEPFFKIYRSALIITTVLLFSFKSYEGTWAPISFYQLLPGEVDKGWLSFLYYIFLSSGFVSILLSRHTNLFYRIFTYTSIFLIGYGSNFGAVDHGLHVIVMCLLISSMPPQTSNRGKSKISSFDVKRGWSIRAIQLYIVYVYLINGFEKLYFGGTSWLTGINFKLILHEVPGITTLGREILILPDLIVTTIPIFVILIEISSPIALYSVKIARLYFIAWTLFHIGVTVVFGGHTNFLSHIICNTSFLLPLNKVNKLTMNITEAVGNIKKNEL